MAGFTEALASLAQRENLLHSGEALLAGVCCLPRGALRKMSVGASLGAAIGATLAAASHARSGAQYGSAAAAVPLTAQMALALTSHRLLVAKRSALIAGRPTAFIGEVPLHHVADIRGGVGRVLATKAGLLTVVMADGSAVELEVARVHISQLERFVATWRRLPR